MKQNQHINNIAPLMAAVVGQVGCITVLIIGAALGAGLLLDKILGTGAIFTVLFMVGSVPLSLYVIVRVSLSTVARTQELMDSQKTEEDKKA